MCNRNIFEHFSTEWKALKVFENESSYVKFEVFKIGDRNCFEVDDENKISESTEPIFAVHVPLKNTLKKILE